MVFYAGQNIVQANMDTDVDRLVEDSPNCLIIANDEGFQELNQHIQGLRVVSKMDNFPKQGHIYLLKPTSFPRVSRAIAVP